MHLRETEHLKQIKQGWLLDTRFLPSAENEYDLRTDYGLTGLERVFYEIVCGIYEYRFACTLETFELSRKLKNNRVFKRPLFRVDGVPYMMHGSGSGHIGYFMEEHSELVIKDPHPYNPQDAIWDDCSEVMFSRAFMEPQKLTQHSWRADKTYWWNNQAYFEGEADTDLTFYVLERRANEVEPPKLFQGRMF